MFFSPEHQVPIVRLIVRLKEYTLNRAKSYTYPIATIFVDAGGKVSKVDFNTIKNQDFETHEFNIMNKVLLGIQTGEVILTEKQITSPTSMPSPSAQIVSLDFNVYSKANEILPARLILEIAFKLVPNPKITQFPTSSATSTPQSFLERSTIPINKPSYIVPHPNAPVEYRDTRRSLSSAKLQNIPEYSNCQGETNQYPFNSELLIRNVSTIQTQTEEATQRLEEISTENCKIKEHIGIYEENMRRQDEECSALRLEISQLRNELDSTREQEQAVKSEFEQLSSILHQLKDELHRTREEQDNMKSLLERKGRVRPGKRTSEVNEAEETGKVDQLMQEMSDLRNLVKELSKKVSIQKETIPQDHTTETQNESQIEERMEELTKKVNLISQREEEVQIEKKMAEIQKLSNKVEEDRIHNEERFEKLERKLDYACENQPKGQVEERIKSLEAKLAVAAQRESKFEEKLKELERKLDIANEREKEAKNVADAIRKSEKASYETIDQKLNEFNKRLISYQEELKQTQIDRAKDITSIKMKVEEASKRLSPTDKNLKPDVQTVQTCIESLKEEFERKVCNMNQEIERLRNKIEVSQIRKKNSGDSQTHMNYHKSKSGARGHSFESDSFASIDSEEETKHQGGEKAKSKKKEQSLEVFSFGCEEDSDKEVYTVESSKTYHRRKCPILVGGPIFAITTKEAKRNTLKACERCKP
eukprot:TRINITY_DN8572_c0_g2_i5.p1 TRINITY_DN8572_c0_g2~~TRINITY_DN8572_c0_g2_i5.p1  ORF type:complete len:706 (+),score=120.30 TRINITY_DN8572_c0_g2_i5:25-2142(+)